MDTASCVSKVEGVPEQRCARGFFEVHRGPSEKYTVGVRRGCNLRVWKDKDVDGFDALLLDAGGGDEDLVAVIQFVLRSRARVLIIESYPTRMQIPPPVPVTHPS